MTQSLLPRLLRSGVTCMLALALVPDPARAQKVEIAVWGGYANSNQRTTDITICSYRGCTPSWSQPHYERHAMAGGVAVRRQLLHWLAIQGGVDLVGKGYGPGPAYKDRRVRSQYLEVPVIVAARVFGRGPFGLHLNSGLAPGVLVSCRTSGTQIDGVQSGPCSEPSLVTTSGEHYHGPTVQHDLTWILVGELRVAVPGGFVTGQARVEFGLVDVQPDQGGRTVNRTGILALGYSRPVRP